MAAELEIDIFGTMSHEIQVLCSDSRKVMFVGHSFVKRFRDWLLSAKNPFGANLVIAWLSTNFLVGLTIPQLYREVQGSCNQIGMSSQIIIDVGGNDLTDDACDEHVACEMLLAFVRYLRSTNSNCVITVLQLLHRRHIYKRRICEQRRVRFGSCCSQQVIECYNKKVDKVNRLLKECLPRQAKVLYWCHRSLWAANKFQAVYDTDGIHLSPAGALKYARSVRGAILQAQNY